MNKISGIYGIFSKDNKKVYVGQSADIKTRWRKHRESLKSNRHHCAYLQRYVNKYGINSITFEVLEESQSENLGQKETEHWDKLNLTHALFNPNRPEGKVFRGKYHPRYGVKDSEETRLKKSLAAKGKTKSENHKKILSELAKNRKAELNPFYGKEHSLETRKRISESRERFEYTVSKNGETFTTRNIKTFCDDLSIPPSNMYKIFNGKAKKCSGFSPVKKKNLDTGEVTLYEV